MPVSSGIKNKHKRAEVYQKERKEKVREKLERRKEQRRVEELDPAKKAARLAQNVPATLESKRVFDETIVGDEDHEGGEEDEFAGYFKGTPPKVLITTNAGVSRTCYDFAAELVGIFPGCEFIKRGRNFSVAEIAKFCANREYTDLIVINEDRRHINGLTFIHLPDGPTFFFTITSITLPQHISGHGRATSHDPELILNNFSTRLGHTAGRMFQALFPQTPQFQGRQVVTLHNQRDFVFFRRHRYVFRDDAEHVALQELGPRFTLKLRRIQRGIKGDIEWEHRPDMEVNRRKFYL